MTIHEHYPYYTCSAIIFSADLLEYLLKDAKCDPNLTTESGCTPLTVASTNQEAVRLLLAFGAKPPYEDWNRYLQGTESLQPVKPRAKVLLLGDPEGGKTTLTKSIEKESEGFISNVLNAWIKVSDENLRTVGIIPHDLHSKQLGMLTLYDMAGHPEFYASHDAALRNVLCGPPSCVILLVADLSRGVEHFRKTIYHWTSFSENLFSDSSQPYLIIIGSHSDLVTNDYILNTQAVIEDMQNENVFFSFQFEGYVTIDCRYSVSCEMTLLRSILSRCCTVSNRLELISFREHCFYVYLMEKFRGKVAITIRDVLEQRDKVDAAQHAAFLPNDERSLFKMCGELNKRGNILFLPIDNRVEESWIVLDKSIVLNRINGSIFAPKEFKEHSDIASDTGIVPHSRLMAHFSDLDLNLVIAFMCHLLPRSE